MFINHQYELRQHWDLANPDSITAAQPQTAQFMPLMTTQIDWRETLCKFLGISPGTDDTTLVETLQDTAERNQLLEDTQPSPSSPCPRGQNPSYQVIYRILCFESDNSVPGLYLEPPWVVNSGRQGAHLRASTEISHFELYLERHKELQFVVYKDYSCCESKPAKEERNNGDSGSPDTYSTSESVCIITEEFSEALNQLSQCTPGNLNCPNFEVLGEFYSPYLWWYQGREVIEEALPKMDPKDQPHINSLGEYIQETLGGTYTQVDSLLRDGNIMAENLSYLYASLSKILLSVASAALLTRVVSWANTCICDRWREYPGLSWISPTVMARISSEHYPESSHSTPALFESHVVGFRWKLPAKSSRTHY